MGSSGLRKETKIKQFSEFFKKQIDFSNKHFSFLDCKYYPCHDISAFGNEKGEDRICCDDIINIEQRETKSTNTPLITPGIKPVNCKDLYPVKELVLSVMKGHAC